LCSRRPHGRITRRGGQGSLRNALADVPSRHLPGHLPGGGGRGRARLPAGGGRLRELRVPRLPEHVDDRQRDQPDVQPGRLRASRRDADGLLHARHRRVHGVLPALGGPGLARGGPVSASRAAPRRRKGFDRRRFLWALYVAVCLYLFVPILVVIVYSFNSGNSLQVFAGFSTRWYRAFWNDPQIKNSLVASFEVAAVTMVVATILGTLLAFGLARARGRMGGSANILMLLPLITPEIVTAVGLLLLFGRVGTPLSLNTIILGHITFSISYVTVIV